eukprot:Skav212513  [mRNA]  locus=scaffold2713:219231:235279:+ [translate_table: standard]
MGHEAFKQLAFITVELPDLAALLVWRTAEKGVLLQLLQAKTYPTARATKEGCSCTQFAGTLDWALVSLQQAILGIAAKGCVALTVEGVAVAMLDMQLDTRDSHELGYASLRLLTVKLRQVAAKTDVEGKAGALWSEVKLRSAHLDVGTGEARHHSKACHSVVRPFTGPLQILHDGEPPPILHLEALLKLVTENQEGSGGRHVCVLGASIQVVVWVLELCSVLKTGTLRQQNAMQHFAHALDAEAVDGWMVGWMEDWMDG